MCRSPFILFWGNFIQNLPFIWLLGFRGEDFFKNQPTQSKNCQWWPCLLMDRDEMSNIYRGSSIDASYQVSIHLAKPFQRRRFVRNRPIRNKNCLWLPCWLTDRDNDRRRMPNDGKYSLCLWQGELKTNWKTN